jgi:hypothetical protein
LDNCKLQYSVRDNGSARLIARAMLPSTIAYPDRSLTFNSLEILPSTAQVFPKPTWVNNLAQLSSDVCTGTHSKQMHSTCSRSYSSLMLMLLFGFCRYLYLYICIPRAPSLHLIQQLQREDHWQTAFPSRFRDGLVACLEFAHHRGFSCLPSVEAAKEFHSSYSLPPASSRPRLVSPPTVLVWSSSVLGSPSLPKCHSATARPRYLSICFYHVLLPVAPHCPEVDHQF